MEQIIINIKPYLEALYFLSGIIVAIVALIALKQVRLMKLDMLARSERAAKEKAIEAVFEYERSNRVYIEEAEHLDASTTKLYSGPVSDFSLDSIPSEFRDMAKRRREARVFVNTLNLLDGVAAMFVTGVADEKTAFPIIGKAFCVDVSTLYDIIVLANAEFTYGSYSNVIELYRVWSVRLTKRDLEVARQNLDKQMEKLGNPEIPPLSPMKRK